MSVAELPSPTVQAQEHSPPVDVPVRRPFLTVEQGIYIAIFACALLTRLWGLGDRALHHDETHHAFFSWRLFAGEGYVHDPLLHGPFLYHIGAFIYFLFGDNDYTARLGAALFGSVLVVLPYLIRRELGRGAAILAAVYILISPVFLYVGRFIRHDPYAVVFELVAFIGIVRYVSTRRAYWLYITAAALGLMLTTMETFFLYVAIFGSFLGLIFLWRVWRPGISIAAFVGITIVASVFVLPGEPIEVGGNVQRASGSYVCPTAGNAFPPANPMEFEPGPVFGFTPLATADNGYSLCVRNQPDDNFAVYFAKLWQFANHPAMFLALGVTVAGLSALYFFIWRLRGANGQTPWDVARVHNDGILEAFASLTKGPRIWIALIFFFVLYALFFTAFFSNTVGVISGFSGSLLYWLGQHGVQRGSQPDYYYLVILTLYEPLLLFWSSVGILMVSFMVSSRLVKRRLRTVDLDQDTTSDTRFTPSSGNSAISMDWTLAMPALLAWWSIMTVLVYSWAGEKMPWLTLHIVLPLTLLGGWALARTLHWGITAVRSYVPPPSDPDVDADVLLPRVGQVPLLIIYTCLIFAVVGFAFFVLAVQTNPVQRPNLAVTPPLLLTFVGAQVAIILFTVCYSLLRGVRQALGAMFLALTLVMSVYTVRIAYQLSYRWGDVPREMMIYTQTSPDVDRTIASLEEVSILRTGGLDMPIWYDNETVWNWYMRDFNNAEQQSPALSAAPGPEVMAVLMLKENIDTYPQNLESLEGFRIQQYPLRWWFPEDRTYRLPPDWATAPVTENSSLLMRLFRNPTDDTALVQLWQYLIYRHPPVPLGSADFILAVRPEVAEDLGLGTGEASANQ
ncbi:MAG: flippase activity-associated protein Agl23 [Chloroflexota bacterium]